MIKRVTFIILSLVVFNYSFYAFSQDNKPPFSLADIEKLLGAPREIITFKAIVNFILERGINFIVTDEKINILRSLGSDEDVINALKRASGEYEKKMFGNLYIESDPPGAKVAIDGYPYPGETPLLIEKLTPGTKKIVVDGVEGYGKYEGEVMIKPSDTVSVRAKLPPLSLFSITIYTDVSFARVYLTGDAYKRKDMGITGWVGPLIIKDLKQGKYTVEIEKEGYKPVKEKIYLDRDKELKLYLGKRKQTVEIKEKIGDRNLTKEKEYEAAFSAFMNWEYKKAREQFEAFIKKFPMDELADDAQFYIAETYYVEEDYAGAIVEYDALLKNYPDSEKAPSALLKQGYSFIEMGDKKAGKGILEQLREKYPKSREADLAKEKLEELMEKRTARRVVQITGEIVAIDAKTNNIKVKGKKGDVLIICDDKTFADIRVGDRVTVKYTENDNKNIAKSVVVKSIGLRQAGKTDEKRGWVSIMSYPKGIVVVDGREIGYTPIKREVPIGQHEISVKVNGNEQKRIIIIRENETVEVPFQFEKSY